MRVEITVSGTSMCSATAMEVSRAEVDASSSGLKRNLEHLDARGSIILKRNLQVHETFGGLDQMYLVT